jgi:hypothetical protein
MMLESVQWKVKVSFVASMNTLFTFHFALTHTESIEQAKKMTFFHILPLVVPLAITTEQKVIAL